MVDFPIYFESKDYLGIALLLPSTAVATVALLFSQRFREVALFVMVAGAVLSQRLDISIYGAYWYRGTTRGFEISFVDILAVALLVAVVLNPKHGRARLYWPAGLLPMLLFLGWAAMTVVVMQPKIFGLYELLKLARGLIIFLAAAYFIRDRREVGIVVLALACAVLFESVWALRQRIFLDIYRAPGTLEHANSLSMYLCMVAPVLVAAIHTTLPKWIRTVCAVALGAAVLGIILTISRAGIPIFIFVVGVATFWCVSWVPSFKKIAAVTLAIAAMAILMWQSGDVIVERYHEATLVDEYLDESKEGRGYYFRQASVILDDRPWGVGLNNWSYWVSKEYGSIVGSGYQDYDDIHFAPADDLLYMYRYAAPAHNLGVLTTSELGWIGLVLFSLLWMRWLQVGAGFLRRTRPEPTYRIGFGVFVACIAMLLHSFTEWTFRQTEIYITFHLIIGMLAALHHRRLTEKHGSGQLTVPKTTQDHENRPYSTQI